MTQQNKNYQKILLLAAFVCGSFFFLLVTYGKAQVVKLSEQEKKELEKKQDQIDDINAKIKAYQQIIDLKNKQGSTLNTQIQSLQAQADKLQLEIDVNEKKIDDLISEIQHLTQRINEKNIFIDRQKRMLAELLRMYYTDYANSSLLPIFLTYDEGLLYFKQESWANETNNKVRELLDSVQTLRDSLMAEQGVLEDKKKEIDTLHIQLSERNESLESAKENKAQLLVKTQAEAKKYDTLVDDLQKQRDEIENEIEELESGKLDSLSLKDMPPFKKGLLAYPLKKFTISQGYGKTSFSKRAYKSGKHNGIDFAASTGTSLYASLGGKVVGVGNNGRYAYGKWVAIDHGNGIITLYGHMNSQSVNKGEKVDTGEKIGTVGNTGYSTGSHVHFSVFSAKSFELVQSRVVKNLWIPIGATVNPNVYLP